MCNSWSLPAFGRERGLIGDGKVALLGCTVTPGFDFADYRSGQLRGTGCQMAGGSGADQESDAELAGPYAALAPLAKEAPQQLRRFLGQNSLLHLHLVVQLRMIQHRKHRPAAPALGSAAANTSRSSRA